MSDEAPRIEIVPVEPLCFKCLGLQGDSIDTMEHPFHDAGCVNDDDIRLWENGPHSRSVSAIGIGPVTSAV